MFFLLFLSYRVITQAGMGLVYLQFWEMYSDFFEEMTNEILVIHNLLVASSCIVIRPLSRSKKHPATDLKPNITAIAIKPPATQFEKAEPVVMTLLEDEFTPVFGIYTQVH
jgi:hypothetical protein